MIGRGGVQLRDPRIQAYVGIRLPKACWGWIWVVPVLITETARIGSVPIPDSVSRRSDGAVDVADIGFASFCGRRPGGERRVETTMPRRERKVSDLAAAGV